MKTIIVIVAAVTLLVGCSSNNETRVQQLEEERESLTLQLASETDTSEINAINKKILIVEMKLFSMETETDLIKHLRNDKTRLLDLKKEQGILLGQLALESDSGKIQPILNRISELDMMIFTEEVLDQAEKKTIQ